MIMMQPDSMAKKEGPARLPLARLEPTISALAVVDVDASPKVVRSQNDELLGELAPDDISIFTSTAYSPGGNVIVAPV